MRGATLLAIACAAVAALGVAPGAAAASGRFAPIDQPGPRLAVPAAKLKASLRCSGKLRGATREPVLLLAATGVNSEQNFSWNYERAFKQLRIPYCTSDVPGPGAANLADLQTRGEYVTYAIRRMHARSGRRIAIVGHSQGGMIMRWSLRFWPDTRAMVADVVGLEGDNHGGTRGDGSCPDGCPVALAQQAYGSRFIRALNSRKETFAGISYTEIYSTSDVDPQGPGLTFDLSGPGRVSTVALQDVCPGTVAHHVDLGTINPIAYALVERAITHPGPARAGQIDRGVCSRGLQPGIDPATLGRDAGRALTAEIEQTNAAPLVTAEPPLREYVFAWRVVPRFASHAVRHGRARVVLRCGGRPHCSGRVTLVVRARSLGASGRGAGRRVTVARRHYRIRAGSHALTLRLDRRARKALREHRLRVGARATLRGVDRIARSKATLRTR